MSDRSNEEIIANIKQVLSEYVEPYVMQHGGEVRFKDYQNGLVMLEMSGACSGCAGSTATLKFGIRNLLIEMIPEVKDVDGMDDPFSNVSPYIMNPYYMDDYIDVVSSGMLNDPNNE